MGKHDPDITVLARKCLQKIWETAGLRGRCWGLKSKNHRRNPYVGTNITMARGDEMVTVSCSDDKLVLHQFKKAEITALGTEVRERLLAEGLPVA